MAIFKRFASLALILAAVSANGAFAASEDCTFAYRGSDLDVLTLLQRNLPEMGCYEQTLENAKYIVASDFYMDTTNPLALGIKHEQVAFVVSISTQDHQVVASAMAKTNSLILPPASRHTRHVNRYELDAGSDHAIRRATRKMIRNFENEVLSVRNGK